MKIQLSGRKPTAFSLLIAAGLLVSSCSYTVMPKSVPLVREHEGSPFTGAAVHVMNAEKETTESAIRTEAGRSSAFVGNKRAWSQKLAESLARELARRGADVRVSAPIIVGVALPKAAVAETRDSLQFTVTASVTLSSGWTKEYQGAASVETSKIFSLSEEADRLAGRALAEIIRSMLGDPDFAAQLKPRQAS